MPLDRALAALLAETRPTPTDVAGARAAHERDALRFTPPDRRDPVGSVRDTAVGPLRLRLYYPDTSAVPMPTIVWFHGGGWTTGSLETGDIVARALCRLTPAVVVSVDYRLAPEHPWPAATDDALAALRWVADHIDELGGDSARIAVGGDSAGGNIAAATAQQMRDALVAQILIYPVLDLDIERDDRYPSLREYANGYHITRETLRQCAANYPPAGADPADATVSPVLRTNLTGVPPTVIAVAEYDPLRDHGTAYANALTAASVPTVLYEG